MTSKPIDAIFENGVFRPLAPLVGIPEGRTVRLTVELFPPTAEPPAEDVLALAAKVYEGLTEEEIDEVDRIALSGRTGRAHR